VPTTHFERRFVALLLAFGLPTGPALAVLLGGFMM
jgi:hypothetical protein